MNGSWTYITLDSRSPACSRTTGWTMTSIRSAHDSRASITNDAIARTKAHVDRVTLPADNEFPPALADFFAMLGGHRQREQFARLEAVGLNTDSDLERHLGRRVAESAG